MARIVVTSEESARLLSTFRVHQWINTETLEPMYGVQAKVEKRRWAHVVSGGKPVLFDSRRDAEIKISFFKEAA